METAPRALVAATATNGAVRSQNFVVFQAEYMLKLPPEMPYKSRQGKIVSVLLLYWIVGGDRCNCSESWTNGEAGSYTAVKIRAGQGFPCPASVENGTGGAVHDPEAKTTSSDRPPVDYIPC